MSNMSNNTSTTDANTDTDVISSPPTSPATMPPGFNMNTRLSYLIFDHLTNPNHTQPNKRDKPRSLTPTKRRRPQQQSPDSPPNNAPNSPTRQTTNPSLNLPLSPRRAPLSPVAHHPHSPNRLQATSLPRFYIKTPQTPTTPATYRHQSITNPSPATPPPEDYRNLNWPVNGGVWEDVVSTVLGLPRFMGEGVRRRVKEKVARRERARKDGGETGSEKEREEEGENAQEVDGTAPVELEDFEYYYKAVKHMTPSQRFFNLLAATGSKTVTRTDFLPYLSQLLVRHPGLDFLASHTEFQEKYAITAITRIFYTCGVTTSGRLTSRQISRGGVYEAFSKVDEVQDINKVTSFFSYEHFYVLYCRFWELDTDRDYRISVADLRRYKDESLSPMAVDNIFSRAPRPFNVPDPTYFSFEDFIYFMLSEEDKGNAQSVSYWFTVLDTDGDGLLSPADLRPYFEQQSGRVASLGHEQVPFKDVMCQMVDMIRPGKREGGFDGFREQDLLKDECRSIGGALIDATININKYLQWESRDPFAERQKREDEFECDWDRYACIDYNRLAMEEEAREEEGNVEMEWASGGEDDMNVIS